MAVLVSLILGADARLSLTASYIKELADRINSIEGRLSDNSGMLSLKIRVAVDFVC